MGGTTTALVAEANKDPAQQQRPVPQSGAEHSMLGCSWELEMGNSTRSNCHYCGRSRSPADHHVVRSQNFGHVRQSYMRMDTEFTYTAAAGPAKSKSLLRMKAGLHHRKS